jgi:membrane protein
MFVILEGRVTVDARGGAFELGPGDFFGELALLSPGTERVARVRAATDVRCIGLPRDEALALIESEPALALAMLRELARRLADAVDG